MYPPIRALSRRRLSVPKVMPYPERKVAMRRTPFIALLMGVVLLSAGLLAMAVSLAQERQQDRTLQHDAAQVA